MIVVVESEVFTSERTDQVQLLRLLDSGFQGQHRVQTDPPYDPLADSPALNRWLEDLSPRRLQEEVRLALESGMETDVQGVPCDVEIRVADIEDAEWAAQPPRLPLPAAAELLGRSLRLLVENQRNDSAFVLAVVPEPWRRHLRGVLERRWAEFEHGGGLTEMRSRVEEATADAVESLRLWVMFDSDAREPGKPSRDSEELKGACQRTRVAHHQLHRREAENYLPLRSLTAWAELGKAREKRVRRQKVDAFAGLSAPQRHFYNMKEGFRRDQRSAEIPGFYGSEAGNPHLQEGLDKNIGALFHRKEELILDEWLLKDGQTDEMLPMAQAILRRM